MGQSPKKKPFFFDTFPKYKDAFLLKTILGSIKKQSFYDQADRKGEGVSAPLALAVHLIVWGLKNALLMPFTSLLYLYLIIL